jgi:hypothetical protein
MISCLRRLLLVLQLLCSSAVLFGAIEEAAATGAGDGSFKIQMLPDGSAGFEELFEVCTHGGAAREVVGDESEGERDSVCGEKSQVISLFADDGATSYFFAVYKTSGGGDHGLAISLLGACYAALLPGKSMVSIQFRVSEDRVLHVSSPGGLSGQHCRTEIPLNDPAVFIECEAPLGELQEVNNAMQEAQSSVQAERDALAAELSAARAEQAAASDRQIALQGQLDRAQGRAGDLEEDVKRLESIRDAETSRLASSVAKLEKDRDALAARLAAEEAGAEQLRQALTSTHSELETKYAVVARRWHGQH